jgi:hypothetical protein
MTIQHTSEGIGIAKKHRKRCASSLYIVIYHFQVNIGDLYAVTISPIKDSFFKRNVLEFYSQVEYHGRHIEINNCLTRNGIDLLA